MPDDENPTRETPDVECPGKSPRQDTNVEIPANGLTPSTESSIPPPPPSASPSAPPATPPPLAPPPEPRDVPFKFHGDTWEFFRIWIVNAALTVVTFGIYAAWAKVRNNKYIYNNLKLDGHSFDYLADPVRILIGNLIVGVGLILYLGGGYIHPLAPVIALLVFLPAFPWLYYKALRFRAHNASYRNIRFRFSGKLGESYLINLVISLAIPFTLGLIYPFQSYKRAEYMYQNLSYGQARFSFSGQSGQFYKLHFAALGIVVIGYFLAFAVAIPIFSGIFLTRSADAGETIPMASIIALQIATSLPIFLSLALAAQFLKAHLTNYNLACLSLDGTIHFSSQLHTSTLFWIYCSNVAAIVCTIGLLTPWARMRMYRYMSSVISAQATANFDTFAASATPTDSALGDSAIEFADFEIGFGI